jgi:hypothetical protein
MKIIALFSILAITISSVSKAETITNIYRVKSASCYDWDYLTGKKDQYSCTPLFFRTLKLTVYNNPTTTKVCVKIGFTKQCFTDGLYTDGRTSTLERIFDFNFGRPGISFHAERDTSTTDDSGRYIKMHREGAWIGDDDVLLSVDDGATAYTSLKGIRYQIKLISTRTSK